MPLMTSGVFDKQQDLMVGLLVGWLVGWCLMTLSAQIGYIVSQAHGIYYVGLGTNGQTVN